MMLAAMAATYLAREEIRVESWSEASAERLSSRPAALRHL
jgi:hypothetical protein